MSQKPSERVEELIKNAMKELQDKNVQEKLSEIDYQALISSIPIGCVMKYLDEEWESRQPCAHPDYEDRYGAKLCKRCNILF